MFFRGLKGRPFVYQIKRSALQAFARIMLTLPGPLAQAAQSNGPLGRNRRMSLNENASQRCPLGSCPRLSCSCPIWGGMAGLRGCSRVFRYILNASNSGKATLLLSREFPQSNGSEGASPSHIDNHPRLHPVERLSSRTPLLRTGERSALTDPATWQRLRPIPELPSRMQSQSTFPNFCCHRSCRLLRRRASNSGGIR